MEEEKKKKWKELEGLKTEEGKEEKKLGVGLEESEVAEPAEKEKVEKNTGVEKDEGSWRAAAVLW